MAADHVAALAVTAVLCGGIIAAAARRAVGTPPDRRATPSPADDAWMRSLSRGFAAFLLAWFAAYPVVVLAQGSYELDFDLPLHLTDVVTVAAVVALWTWRPLPFELTWFWGLTASLQAILTPDLGADDRFPSFFYWHYFVTHGGVVVTAVLLAFGVGLTARPGAVRRVFVATLAWTAVAAIGNAITGGNYMFLTEKPDAATLLDYMGPWPWYILSAAILALLLFALLDLPFRRRRRGPGGAAASAALSLPAPPRQRRAAGPRRSPSRGR
jgi:hypothetical integral membrane protein (TIGR02206 family)